MCSLLCYLKYLLFYNGNPLNKRLIISTQKIEDIFHDKNVHSMWLTRNRDKKQQKDSYLSRYHANIKNSCSMGVYFDHLYFL